MDAIHSLTLGLQNYQHTWQKMRAQVDARTEKSPDEIWLLEHPPVYTLGQAGLLSHIINPGSIEVIRTDRGGQVTYHGPGQLVMYTLFNLERLNLGTRSFVQILEQAIMQFLTSYSIESHLLDQAPGVYVKQKKIASIGLRVRKGNTYHGISLNVDMDLTPFQHINPCGYKDLKMTQLKQEKPNETWNLWQIGTELSNLVAILLQKNNIHFAP